MGLDVSIAVDNPEHVFTPEYLASEHRRLHRLSRTFCKLLLRRDKVHGRPELEQLGDLLGVEVAFLYRMERSGGDATNGVEIVAATDFVRRIASAHASAPDLAARLEPAEYLVFGDDGLPRIEKSEADDAWREAYFSTRASASTNRAPSDRFSDDLGNLLRFLDYARERGSQRVYLEYH